MPLERPQGLRASPALQLRLLVLFPTASELKPDWGRSQSCALRQPAGSPSMTWRIDRVICDVCGRFCVRKGALAANRAIKTDSPRVLPLRYRSRIHLLGEQGKGEKGRSKRSEDRRLCGLRFFHRFAIPNPGPNWQTSTCGGALVAPHSCRNTRSRWTIARAWKPAPLEATSLLIEPHHGRVQFLEFADLHGSKRSADFRL